MRRDRSAPWTAARFVRTAGRLALGLALGLGLAFAAVVSAVEQCWRLRLEPPALRAPPRRP